MSQASPPGSTSPPSFVSTLESHANTLSYSGALWSNGLYSLQFWNTVHKHHPRFLLDRSSKPPASTIHVVSCVIFLCVHCRVVVSGLKIVLVAFFVAFSVVEGKLEHPCSILFLFAAADIFKGKNKKMSGAVLGGATASLALFELMQEYLLTQFAMP